MCEYIHTQCHFDCKCIWGWSDASHSASNDTACWSAGPAEQETSKISMRFLSFPNLKFYPMFLMVIALAVWFQQTFSVKSVEKKGNKHIGLTRDKCWKFSILADSTAEHCNNQYYYHLNLSPPSSPDPCFGVCCKFPQHHKYFRLCFMSHPSSSHKQNFYFVKISWDIRKKHEKF